MGEDAAVGAIIEAWYGGQSTGQAVADALLGIRNPAGRLPVTVYEERWATRVPMGDMRMAPDHTYRYYAGPVVWPFGFGLSYTSFSLSLSATGAVPPMPRGLPLVTTLSVRNVGNVASDFCALLMLVPPQCPTG